MSDLKTESLFSLQDLKLAWERVNASVGTDTKDFFGINIYSKDVYMHLNVLHEDLLNNRYQPKRPFKYFEPKESGTQRTKTVLMIDDAIVYQAIADKIAYELYEYLLGTRDHVYGSVLSENVARGVALLDEDDPDYYFFEYYVNFYNRFIEEINIVLDSSSIKCKLETDITGFFDCIPHSTLMLELFKHGIDKKLLDLLAASLNKWSGTRDMPTFGVGIPQGPAASFLLANIILDGLDKIIINKNLKYFRFMDDIRIYGEGKNDIRSALVLVDRYLKGMSLSLNTSKTAIQFSKSYDEEKDFILDSSGIPLEKKQDRSLGDIVVQDKTQLGQYDFNIQRLTEDKALSLYLRSLNSLEKELLDLYFIFNEYEVSEAIPKKVIRSFLTLSQKWRVIVKAIKSIQNYSPNQELVKVWICGIKLLFWKANSMVWNLKCYDNLASYYPDLELVISEHDHFEWVKYQVLNIYGKVIISNVNRQKIIISQLKNEKSPLVRLGYYSILVEAIQTDSNLFGSLSEILKEEKEEYVKQSVLNLIHQEHLNIPIDNLKDWFL